jgi:hypothetical protein
VTDVYHITHLRNLPSIFANGLVCDSAATSLGLTAVDIGYTQIKGRRALRTVPVAAGGNLNDYVPFYFGPRSPMLYTIARGNVPQYQDGQDRIVHLVLDANAAAAAGLAYAYTDGHAVMAISEFFTDLNEVMDHVDFNLMRATFWNDTDERPDRKRRRQAEFLVHGQVPWALIESIGVMSEAIRVQVLEMMQVCDHRPPVDVRREWYY